MQERYHDYGIYFCRGAKQLIFLVFDFSQSTVTYTTPLSTLVE